MTRTAVAYLRPPADHALEAADLELVAVVAEDDPQRRGLGRALQHIAAGEANTLFVNRLRAVAGSLGELVRLLDWLASAGADLVAVDVGLDTGERGGRRAVALLREIDRWGREPDQPRRPRGRPGLTADSPALAERIALMRERGLSLQAIAAALNDEGVPTPRGGARWRPSSVQSALGYRRPRPPAPGAPPPRPSGGPPPRPSGGPPPRPSGGPPPPPRRPRPRRGGKP